MIALMAMIGGLALLLWHRGASGRPDLVLVTFAKEHTDAYRKAAARFEKATGVRVEVQLTEARALYSRLSAAMETGAEVPDLVEVLDTNMGTFTRGPVGDIGFVDLTDRLRDEGWLGRLVPSRLTLWSSRGRVFAVPHDVHPTMLAYRTDLIAAEGIDVKSLITWPAFSRVGREVVARHRRGQGRGSDRYMMDLPVNGGLLVPLLLQRGVNLLDEKLNVTFDSPAAVDVLEWYIRSSVDGAGADGDGRIAFDAGWGQNLAKAINDGLVLFLVCPDWRCKSLEIEMPGLKGRMGLIPMPAWEEGGRRTTVWGGTGLAIPKGGKRQDRAWEFAKYIYLNQAELEERFRDTPILPPVATSWTFAELDRPDEYFSGLPRGRMYAELAPTTPARYVTPFSTLAEGKLTEALVNSTTYYSRSGGAGLRKFIEAELHRTAGQVREQMARNVFLREPETVKEGGR
jgi:arabinosaccharide transport system substrate-binding protein